jgi:hypothetical protein
MLLNEWLNYRKAGIMDGLTNRLQGPYEILELEDGQTKEIRPVRWEKGTVVIYPQHKPTGKEVLAVRLHVAEADKDFSPFYWDVTSQTLNAQLLPYLLSREAGTYVLVIQKHGIAPKARFTLQVRPV